MRPTPTPARFAAYPVTGGLALLAVGVTIATAAGYDISVVTLDVRAFWSEPWRLVTSALPHIGVFHLVFNLYWLWVFGTAVEDRYGHLKTLVTYAVLAAVSGAAEYALFDGGVGLSGVGYGLFGLLLVLSRRVDFFREAVDRRTASIFAIWFVACIVMTQLDVMRVANVAHGVGFVAGVAYAGIIGQRGLRRALAVLGFVAVTAASFVGATVGRPVVNLSTTAGQMSAYLGYRALVDEDPAAAVRHYQRALSLREEAGWHYNLGLAYLQLDRPDDAVRSLRRAVELDPDDARYRGALESVDVGAASAGS